jgi:tetratricopeptide (TPR) repeat protein
LQRSKENRDISGLFTGHTGLGLSYEGLRAYEKAAEHFHQAIVLTEEMRESLSAVQRTNFYDAQIWGIPRITPYEGLSRVLLQSGKGEQALRDAAEGTKARVFVEALAVRSQAVARDVPRDVANRDSEINNKLSALLQGLQKAQEKGSKDAIESFEKQAKEVRAERDAHIKKLRKDYPLFAATRYPQAMDLDHVAIKPDERVVEYQVTDTGIAIFLLHGKKLAKSFFKPVPRKDLEALVRKFREPLEVTPGQDRYTEKLKSFDFDAGKKLADLLLADLLPDLPKGTPVIVVPDQCLGVLPFEMLVLNTGGAIKLDKKIPYVSGTEFFGDRNSISYYQSITALTLARTLGKQKKSQEKLLVMADPVFQMKDARAQDRKPGPHLAGVEARLYEELMATVEDGKVGSLRLNRLPFTGELAENLSMLFRGSCATYTGLNASKAAFVKDIAPRMGDYSRVVFATHGYFGKDLPGITEPVLIFTCVPPGTDGYLRMSEVMGLQMNADVVALTACQTGLGRQISGEGTMGMGRAFQYAGARSVLMSLWSVAEKASVQMVESFFRHVKDGKGKLEALRLARQEIRDQGYDHPFYWAAFILVGEVD